MAPVAAASVKGRKSSQSQQNPCFEHETLSPSKQKDAEVPKSQSTRLSDFERSQPLDGPRRKSSVDPDTWRRICAANGLNDEGEIALWKQQHLPFVDRTEFD